uniref:Uncharacterized protein n=1 Tax=Arundo donax TaxID=35708 RepID=A0A0A8XSM5_ARUDO
MNYLAHYMVEAPAGKDSEKCLG